MVGLVLLTACSDTHNEGIPVTKVVDGDTIKVQLNGKEETIRMLLIDTPETVHPNKPVQPFGPEASQFVKSKLEDQNVTLEMDISERDKYGRLLAYVYTMDGEMINERLLEEGLARVAYVFEPNTKYVDNFYKIQQQAQQEEKGIWSMENYATDEGSNYDAAVDTSAETIEKQNSGCDIKGNINSSGEKIYHLSSGRYYKQTKAERIFCTEAEAKKAGFRKALQ
nr:thermonuclease family protein [Bacillus taeanensis]